jgi:hypothetical protein
MATSTGMGRGRSREGAGPPRVGPPVGSSARFRAAPAAIAAVAAIALMALALSGCGGSGKGPARDTVNQALAELERARPLLEDLRELNAKINDLGKRFTSTQDTISEGMSLVDLINGDISELEVVLGTARELFGRVAEMQEAGDYREYAELAGQAVEKQAAALQTNRELVRTLAELLSLVEVAESGDQLQYYVDELERLAGELERRNVEAARLAGEADSFYSEKKL